MSVSECECACVCVRVCVCVCVCERECVCALTYIHIAAVDVVRAADTRYHYKPHTIHVHCQNMREMKNILNN